MFLEDVGRTKCIFVFLLLVSTMPENSHNFDCYRVDGQAVNIKILARTGGKLPAGISSLHPSGMRRYFVIFPQAIMSFSLKR